MTGWCMFSGVGVGVGAAAADIDIFASSELDNSRKSSDDDKKVEVG